MIFIFYVITHIDLLFTGYFVKIGIVSVVRNYCFMGEIIIKGEKHEPE